jgi:23S rRNA pseudouridine1911/1915/1917 synthase
LTSFSRVRIQGLLKTSCIQVNCVIICDQNFKLKNGDVVDVVIPVPKESKIVANKKDFNIVYEDDDLIVVDKPAGLTVHPGAGNIDNTLVNALLDYCGSNLSGIGGVLRPGIVHRLDKDTSGLMVVAKNDLSHIDLSSQISQRLASRIYQAIVWGVPLKTSGIIENFIGRSYTNRLQMKILSKGKFASTSYNLVRILGGGKASIVQCKLKTGRTHQIRVHMTSIGHSIVGDQLYGQNSRKIANYIEIDKRDIVMNFQRQALHSCVLSFKHPRTKIDMQFESQMPNDLQNLIQIFDK